MSTIDIPLHPTIVGSVVQIEISDNDKPQRTIVGTLRGYLTEPDGYTEAIVEGIIPTNQVIVLSHEAAGISHRIVSVHAPAIEQILSDIEGAVRR